MRRRSLVRPALALVALVAALASGGAPPEARACCTAFPKGERPVEIAAQEILIVWDPTTKKEHFVRKAEFGGGHDGFGFLVPSPTRPEVEASRNEVFVGLDEVSRARVQEETRWEVSVMPLLAYPFAVTMRASRGGAGMSDGIDVLEQKHVAGYDVAVLAASDTRSLVDWLAANHFDARPELQEWARPYVAKGWIITAFRYAPIAGNTTAAEAVRMTFGTDAPLFPYRVPTDVLARPGDAHLLRTYVVGPGRASGTLGEGSASRPWDAGKVKRALPVPSAELARLVGAALPAGALAPLGEGAWLTTFDDRTWPGGTEDLTFALDPKGEEHQEVYYRYTDRTLPLPPDAILGLGLLGLFLRRKLKGAPKAKEA
jgi:hypothetical protein